MNHNAKPKRARVLRATDVMPPFDKDTSPANSGEVDTERPGSVSPESAETENRAGDNEAASRVGQLLADPVVIPTYDLAENILAEQRRVASRRRRAPGQAPVEPTAPSAPACPTISVADPLPCDLPELQRVVAEIVARDIARLCRRPDRQLSA